MRVARSAGIMAATTATHAKALQARAYLGWHRLEGQGAVDLAREAAALAQRAGDRRTEARALYADGEISDAIWLADGSSELHEAYDYYQGFVNGVGLAIQALIDAGIEIEAAS